MNPFTYDSIASGDSFYDRKDETQRVVQTLLGGNNMVLFAPRRYGKTSLVYKAMEQLSALGVDCVYMDWMPVYSLESFAEQYLKALSKKQTIPEWIASHLSSITSLRPTVSFDTMGKPTFSVDFMEQKVTTATIADILDIPEQMANSGRRVVVVMDEFQEVMKLSKYNMEALLRSKIQLHKHANYLFLGSKTHLMQDMFMRHSRPFYQSASTMQLSLLPKQDTIQFLQEKFGRDGIGIRQEECLYIMQQVDNIPYYIQLLSAEVWQALMPNGKEVTRELIDTCCRQVIRLKQDYYYELFSRLAGTHKKVLLAIANQGKNIFSAEYICEHRLVAASTVQKAVRLLQDEGIVDKEQDTYFVADPFFRRYLLQTYE